MQVLISLGIIFSLSGFGLEATQDSGSTLSFPVTDKRKIITRSINKNLLLRVVKEGGANQKDYGWSVEVVRKPHKRAARNLLYHSKLSGAHPSQIFAWHVAEKAFPNERELEVKGFPIKITVELLNAEVEGEGAYRRFVTGEIKITWERK